MFQLTTVNYFVGGESFHQTATYLTVEAEGKEIPFLFEYLKRVGGRSDFFFLQRSELEDILMGEDFVILNRE